MVFLTCPAALGLSPLSHSGDTLLWVGVRCRLKSLESLGPHIAMGCRPLSSVIRLLCVVQFSIVR